jgi:hypothetical protein
VLDAMQCNATATRDWRRDSGLNRLVGRVTREGQSLLAIELHDALLEQRSRGDLIAVFFSDARHVKKEKGVDQMADIASPSASPSGRRRAQTNLFTRHLFFFFFYSRGTRHSKDKRPQLHAVKALSK